MSVASVENPLPIGSWMKQKRRSLTANVGFTDDKTHNGSILMFIQVNSGKFTDNLETVWLNDRCQNF